jgi:hypothetical protein
MMHVPIWVSNSLRVATLCAFVGVIPDALIADDQPTANELISDPRSIPIALPGQTAKAEFLGPVTATTDEANLKKTVDGNPLWSIPLSSLAAIADFPLFSSSRRPAPTGQAVVASKPPAAPIIEGPPRPIFVLMGAIAGDSEGIAILRDDTTKVVLRLKTGESYFGWTLHAVRGRDIILRKDKETAIVALSNPGK